MPASASVASEAPGGRETYARPEARGLRPVRARDRPRDRRDRRRDRDPADKPRRGRRGRRSLGRNLSVLRGAIDRYQAEHGGTFPTAADFEAQLTLYTDAQGAPSPVKGGAFVCGPYLRKLPALPLGVRRGRAGVRSADGASVGWIYEQATGDIRSNTTAAEVDASGKPYGDY
jgi:hypothetical protein